MSKMVNAELEEQYNYEQAIETADWIHKQIGEARPVIGLICGLAFNGIVEIMEETISLWYGDIPNFPKTTIEGHVGRLIFGKMHGRPMICLQGRFHSYEGHSLMKCAFPVRVLRCLGIQCMVVTGESGSLNTGYKAGDIMVIKDHVNLPGFSGNNPLKGHNDERFGARFPPMNKSYDKRLRELVLDIAEDLDMRFVQEGVFAMIGGPCFETPSEARLLKQLGADAVGMSIAPEVIIAVHCGMRVLGLAFVSNRVVLDNDVEAEVSEEHIRKMTQKRAEQMEILFNEFIKNVPNELLKQVEKRKKIAIRRADSESSEDETYN